MNAATFVLLLAVGGAAMHAQNSATPSGDVTIGMFEGKPEYCLGEISNPLFGGGPQRGPDDITLRLPLKLIYENHRHETLILPTWIHYLTRMTVAGQNGSTVLTNRGNGGMDVNNVMALSRPDLSFSIIAAGKFAWYTGVEGVVIAVLDHSSGLDLRGKAVQIVMTRDFRSLSPEAVEKLSDKWKDYGDRLDGSCGIRHVDVPDSEGTGDAKLHNTGGEVAVSSFVRSLYSRDCPLNVHRQSSRLKPGTRF